MAQLGKYSTDSHNILHFLCTSGWANKSFGDVEAPTGYVWWISNDPADVQVSNTEVTSLIEDQLEAYDIEDGPEFRKRLEGHFLIREDSNGFVSVSEHLTEMSLRREYERLEREFAEWDTEE